MRFEIRFVAPTEAYANEGTSLLLREAHGAGKHQRHGTTQEKWHAGRRT